MGKVLSLSTGAQLDKQDCSENDKLAAQGIYLGRISVLEAEAMRGLQDRLTCEKAKLDELIADFDMHYQDYLENVLNVYILLDMDYNKYTTKDLLMFSEDGNVWLAKK